MEFTDLYDDVLGEIYCWLDARDLIYLSRVAKTYYDSSKLQYAIVNGLGRLKCCYCKYNNNGTGYIVDNEYVCVDCMFEHEILEGEYEEIPDNKDLYKYKLYTSANNIYVLSNTIIKHAYPNETFELDPGFLDVGFTNEKEYYTLSCRWFSIELKEDCVDMLVAINIRQYRDEVKDLVFLKYLWHCNYDNPVAFVIKLTNALDHRLVIPDLDYLIDSDDYHRNGDEYSIRKHPYDVTITKALVLCGRYEESIKVIPPCADIVKLFVEICETQACHYDFPERLKEYTRPMKTICRCGAPAEFKCECCTFRYCINCSAYIMNLHLCSFKNCHDCRKGQCHGMYIKGEYCRNCCTDDLIAEYAEKLPRWIEYQKAVDAFDARASERKQRLKRALNNAGIDWRDDSGLCAKYVETGSPSIKYIVRRMGEVKYLFDCCDMKNEIKKAKQERYDYDSYDVSAFDLAETNILKRIRHYPIKFSWDKRPDDYYFIDEDDLKEPEDEITTDDEWIESLDFELDQINE